MSTAWKSFDRHNQLLASFSFISHHRPNREKFNIERDSQWERKKKERQQVSSTQCIDLSLSEFLLISINNDCRFYTKMMRSDIRRCRRCKRKRLDDEPMEVRQYKTCAKCRIIERNKKNLRKPLAIETMLYGLKQFREQQSTENYIEEEGLLKDEFFKRYHNKPFNYDAEIAKVLNDPNYEPPVITNITDEIIETSDVASPNGTRYQVTIRREEPSSPTRTRIPRAEKIKKPRQPYKKSTAQYKQMLSHVSAHHVPHPISIVTRSQPSVDRIDEKEELIGELLALGEGKNLECSFNGHANPYQFANVYSNFEQYLQRILELKSSKKNISNLVFLKEFRDSFPKEMSKYHADASVGDRSSQNLDLNERQSRMNLLSNLKALYVDPIIASTSLPFEQKSNNLHDFKYPSELRCYYQYRDRVEVADNKLDPVNSTISLSYHKKYNILTIKFNLVVIDKLSQYPSALKDAVVELLKKTDAKPVYDDDKNVQELVFQELQSMRDTFEESVKVYIDSFTLEKLSDLLAAINDEVLPEDGDVVVEEELDDELDGSDDDVEAGVEGNAEVDDEDDDDDGVLEENGEDDVDVDNNNNDDGDDEVDDSKHLQPGNDDVAETPTTKSDVLYKSISEVATEAVDPTLKL